LNVWIGLSNTIQVIKNAVNDAVPGYKCNSKLEKCNGEALKKCDDVII